MRGLLTKVAAIGLIGTCLLLAPAYGGTKCQQTNPATGKCLIWVQTGGTTTAGTTSDDGPKDTGSGHACYWDPTKQGLRKPPAGPVPCSSGAGAWSNAHNCYVRAAKPQPAADDAAWQGHQPGDGAVYSCYQPQTDLLVSFWAQTAPVGSGAGPSPRAVAELAMKQMGLSAIDIGIVPEPGPDSIGLVGMPVWMWAKAPNEHTVGPIAASASAGGITVTATAKVLRITWDMGDGTKVVCETAGTPYKPSYGRKNSPDCGHTYEKSSAHEAGDVYPVTATSSWVVTWSGAGQTGTIRLGGLSRSTQIRIGEAQVLVN